MNIHNVAAPGSWLIGCLSHMTVLAQVVDMLEKRSKTQTLLLSGRDTCFANDVPCLNWKPLVNFSISFFFFFFLDIFTCCCDSH